MKIGIVGKGDFGNKIYSKLVDKHEIVFFTGREMNISHDIDWVVIASSNESHYGIVKHFLERSINTFCEKPLTLTYRETLELVEYARKKNIKLYIDDVFRYRKEYQEYLESDRKKPSTIKISWYKFGSFKDNIYNNLTYHDLYLVADLIPECTITGLKHSEDAVNKKEFCISFSDSTVYFKYDRKSTTSKKILEIDGYVIDFTTPVNDALSEMLDRVFAGEVDYEYNQTLALRAQQVLDRLLLTKPKVAVVGAGIFGISAAIKLQQAGLEVTLFEKENDILPAASSINQYRLHRGYHYPRSFDTAISSMIGTESFLQTYDCKVKQSVKHYYCIASKDSLIDENQYRSFLDQANLEYKECVLPLLVEGSTNLTVEVVEDLFNPEELRTLCKAELNRLGIKFLPNCQFDLTMSKSYAYTVNATYANLNNILPEDQQQEYQFELCEKPILKLPVEYKGISIVVMDGPFTCIDPLGESEYHVMGNVVHAIHHTNTGTSPEIPEELRTYLNKGIIKNPAVTNIDKFISSASKFFKGITEAKHIGSMYTIRTVLPRRDHDDARPSYVKMHSPTLFSVFSGKISTCVNTANNITELILKN